LLCALQFVPRSLSSVTSPLTRRSPRTRCTARVSSRSCASARRDRRDSTHSSRFVTRTLARVSHLRRSVSCACNCIACAFDERCVRLGIPLIEVVSSCCDPRRAAPPRAEEESLMDPGEGREEVKQFCQRRATTCSTTLHSTPSPFFHCSCTDASHAYTPSEYNHTLIQISFALCTAITSTACMHAWSSLDALTRTHAEQECELIFEYFLLFMVVFDCVFRRSFRAR
jgi:hypothetical protein